MLNGLHHVGIAVADIDAAVHLYTTTLSAGLIRRGHLNGLDFAPLDSGGVELELLAAADPDTAIGKFAGQPGPGLHHLAYAVADLEAELALFATEAFQQSGT